MKAIKIKSIMKIRSFILASAALAGFAACNSVTDTTRISGTVQGEGIEEVNIIVQELGIDTLVALTDGRFSYELPVNVTAIGSVSAGDFQAQFIPDGSKITVDLSAEPVVKSSADHVQRAFSELLDTTEKIEGEYSEKVQAISRDTNLSDEEKAAKSEEAYEETIAGYVDYNKTVIAENPDNIVGVVALSNISGGMLSDEESLELIAGLSEPVQEHKFVASMKKSLEARSATAEGSMFTDFTITEPDGKEVRFSDFVGKGKYVLVDFWASWCGPCKREIPNIKAVYDKYKGKDFDVLSVAVWDKPEDTARAAREHGVNWSQIVNAQSVPTEIYGIDGIPHIMLVGPDGTILKRGLRGADIEAEVAKYIKK